jgi:hypothetical protein
MNNVGDVVVELRQALALVDNALNHLRSAQDDTESGARAWQSATCGSMSSDVVATAGQWQQVADQLSEIVRGLVILCERIRTYVAGLGGASEPVAAPYRSTFDKAQGGDEREVDPVETIRRRVGTTPIGTETKGVWIRADGTTEDLRSGTGTEWYGETRQFLLKLGGRRGRELARLATHIEAQFVRRMAEQGMTECTLVLSRSPCATPPADAEPFTCDSQLGNMIRALLLPGATLTVVDPQGKTWTYPEARR